MLFWGCDGGATKTEFIISDNFGRVLTHNIFEGCSFGLMGAENFKRFMDSKIQIILKEANVVPEDIDCAVFGLPTYGEIEGSEQIIEEIIGKNLPLNKVQIKNDSVLGWSGALSGNPGIQIAAGTGSIAYGRDNFDNDMRVAGWSLYFSDEGSCAWIARMTIACFMKQADGRMPKTAIYDVFRDYFHLEKKDLYFTGYIPDLLKDTSKLADLQRLTLKAFQLGDPVAKGIYEKAVNELVHMAVTIRENLKFPPDQPVKVSYSGGLFRVGDAVMIPFQKRILQEGFILVEPQYPPYIGALALAASGYLSETSRAEMLKKAYAAVGRDF